ncbi:MAG: low molecular weight protein-tyrosine-phosphatase, partial [Panacibacter sp.]
MPHIPNVQVCDAREDQQGTNTGLIIRLILSVAKVRSALLLPFMGWGKPQTTNCFIFAVMKILMVCLGNICRSPLAEGILQHKANAAGLDWKVDSAGTGNYHIGSQPHQLSQKVAKQNGVNICDQKARQFVKEDMQAFDKIYVMDADNYNDIKRISRELWDAGKTDL